jgi:hypothetical protein
MVRQVGPTRTTRCGERHAKTTSRNSPCPCTYTGPDLDSVRDEGHLLDLVQPPQSTLNLPPRRLHHRELGYRQRRRVPDAAFEVGDLCSKRGILIG